MKFSAGAFTQRFLMFERECGNWQKRYLHFFVPANAQKTIFETAMKKNQKSAAIGFIFITLLIDITGWGIVIPVVPALIRELIHNPDLSAVSYTHLDVYKRQGYYRTKNQRANRNDSRKRPGKSGGENAG